MSRHWRAASLAADSAWRAAFEVGLAYSGLDQTQRAVDPSVSATPAWSLDSGCLVPLVAELLQRGSPAPPAAIASRLAAVCLLLSTFQEEFGEAKAVDYPRQRTWRDKFMCAAAAAAAEQLLAHARGVARPPGRCGPHRPPPLLLLPACSACLLDNACHKLRSKARYLDELEDRWAAGGAAQHTLGPLPSAAACTLCAAPLPLPTPPPAAAPSPCHSSAGMLEKNSQTLLASLNQMDRTLS